MQEWSNFAPVGNWTASVTLYKDGERVTVFNLASVEVLETGTGDLDPETGMPVEADHRLSIAGVIEDPLPED